MAYTGHAFSVPGTTVLTAFKQAPLFELLGTSVYSIDPFTDIELNRKVPGATLLSTLEGEKLKIRAKNILKLIISFYQLYS